MAKLRWRSLVFCNGGISNSVSSRPSDEIRLHKKKSSTSTDSGVSPSSAPTSPEDLSLAFFFSDLEVFSFSELKIATKSFSKSQFVGAGGFGPVYKGSVDGGLTATQDVAVKVLDRDGTQGHKEWLAEVLLLGQLRHPNLVKLIGYCCENENRLLVYEFMARGSLEKHLFNRLQLSPLPWTVRMNIAVGAAKGLAFLHEARKPVICRDFKTSNILLDMDYEAKLSDFGLAKDGPEGDNTHVSTRVMGTHGYAAPEYILTGHLTAKSDVYSFGVVLLELLTGRRSFDKTRPAREQNLVDWAKPYLQPTDNAAVSRRRLEKIIDASLDGEYSDVGARKAADVALQCLHRSPKSRPTMRAVVDALEPILELRDIPISHFVYNVPPTPPVDAAAATSTAEEPTATATGGARLQDPPSTIAVSDLTATNKREKGHMHKQRTPSIHYDVNGLLPRASLAHKRRGSSGSGDD